MSEIWVRETFFTSGLPRFARNDGYFSVCFLSRSGITFDFSILQKSGATQKTVPTGETSFSQKVRKKLWGGEKKLQKRENNFKEFVLYKRKREKKRSTKRKI
jgi:hypothetical protein